MATSPLTLPPGTVVFITPNGANVIQEGHGVPSTLMQPPGMGQYVGQQFDNPNLEHQIPQMGLLEKLRKLETKTLGTIQIMMGLIHVGLGGVSMYAESWPSPSIGGYPVWGGALFIISGSLSVSAENRLKIGLVKCSGGFNSISAIISLIGSILYWMLLIGNRHYPGEFVEVSFGLCALILIFSTLEFCITASTAYLELKLIHHHNVQDPVFMPYTVSEDPMAASVPPSYDCVVSSQK